MSSHVRGRGRGSRKNYYGNDQNLNYDQLLDKACNDSKKIIKEKEERDNIYVEKEEDNFHKNYNNSTKNNQQQKKNYHTENQNNLNYKNNNYKNNFNQNYLIDSQKQTYMHTRVIQTV